MNLPGKCGAICSLALSMLILGAGVSLAELPATSVLTPAGENPPLEKSFSSFTPAEKSRFRLHGIRSTMLHPQLWGSLAREKTHNVRIVPIKRFFLRSSEDPSYRLKSIEVTFRFLAADKASILKSPHELDPIFEVGFATRIQKEAEQALALRVSAYPNLASGFFEYRDGKSTLQGEATPRNVGAYQAHVLHLEFDEGKVKAILDEHEFAELSRTEVSQGMVYLLSSWHPVYLSALKIQGRVQRGGETVVLEESGLLQGESEK